MKLIPIIAISLIIAISCMADASIFDTLRDKDKTLAAVLSYEVDDNRVLRIRFDTPVSITEYRFNNTVISASYTGNEIILTLPKELGYGEEATVSLTARKDNGNATRASLRIEGTNRRLPKMLINELSTDGTGAAPDRAELYCIAGGCTAGMVLSDSPAKDGNEVQLPSIEVTQGDIIVVYWDKSANAKDYKRPSGKTVFISGKAKATLPSRNGMLTLKSSRQGNIMDAVIYSDSNCSGFSEKAAADARLLIESGHWSGDAVDSSNITSSRVLARRPGAVDTDTADDWFITQPRKSTFGEENIYAPYTGDE